MVMIRQVNFKASIQSGQGEGGPKAWQHGHGVVSYSNLQPFTVCALVWVSSEKNWRWDEDLEVGVGMGWDGWEC